MKKALLLIILVLCFTTSFGQQLVKLKLSPLDGSEYAYNSNIPQLKFNFNKEIITVMGGLNDLDGMNNYFNIYGSKLIIQQKDISSNGVVKLILRREDGNNFYGQYPTLEAEIRPYQGSDESLSAIGMD
ncbi:MAG: hypothetical protein WBB27_10145 [Maribacter sp.]